MRVLLHKRMILRRTSNRPWATLAKALVLSNICLLCWAALDAVIGCFFGAIVGTFVSSFIRVGAEDPVFLGLVCGYVVGGSIGLVNGVRVLVREASKESKNEPE